MIYWEEKPRKNMLDCFNEIHTAITINAPINTILSLIKEYGELCKISQLNNGQDHHRDELKYVIVKQEEKIRSLEKKYEKLNNKFLAYIAASEKQIENKVESDKNIDEKESSEIYRIKWPHENSLHILTERELKTVALRSNMTLKSIGELLGVHPERVRQILAKSYRKLRMRFYPGMDDPFDKLDYFVKHFESNKHVAKELSIPFSKTASKMLISISIMGHSTHCFNCLEAHSNLSYLMCKRCREGEYHLSAAQFQRNKYLAECAAKIINLMEFGECLKP